MFFWEEDQPLPLARLRREQARAEVSQEVLKARAELRATAKFLCRIKSHRHADRAWLPDFEIADPSTLRKVHRSLMSGRQNPPLGLGVRQEGRGYGAAQTLAQPALYGSVDMQPHLFCSTSKTACAETKRFGAGMKARRSDVKLARPSPSRAVAIGLASASTPAPAAAPQRFAWASTWRRPCPGA